MTGLQPIAEGLWEANHDLFMGGIVHFRGRMTVIRLRDGSLVLHSPVPIDDALAAELAALGPVEHIIAPNLFHHVHLAPVLARYPDATSWGPRGLTKKRKDLDLDAELGNDTAPWAPDLTQMLLPGMPALRETVFLHAPSKTLIVTDLVFNIHDASNWFSRVLFRVFGAWRRLASSRLLKSTVKDRGAVAGALAEILEWDFDRLVLAHGRIIDANAKAALEPALGWAAVADSVRQLARTTSLPEKSTPKAAAVK